MTNRQVEHVNLEFPLNVFAHCLYLQEGCADYLHYGLFNQRESIHYIYVRQVQQRSTELLLSRLPPPCRVLEVGIGLGTTALQLADRGYTVTGISPDAQQVVLAKQRVGDKVSFECVTFEAFSAPAQSYDVILFQESAQYIRALTLFNKAHYLLAEQGFVLIADEVGLRRTPKDTVDSLPLLTYTIAQAQRCGFNLTEQLDLSAQAAPSVKYLFSVVEKHRAALQADLDLSPTRLDDLLASLREYQQKYREGRYGYVFLKFAKTKPPRWKITHLTPDDKKTVRELFSEVFEPQEMSDALWEWKYGQQRGLGIVAWRDGKMVAHYGAIVREIQYFGQSKLAVQIADVMVSAKERSLLTRRGAFFLTAATFPECYVGYGAKTWLGYGFPTERAMKVAQRLGLYAPVGKLIELRWHSAPGKSHLWTRIRHLRAEQPETNKLIINRLWQKMAACLPVVGVRDWKYVEHRYLSHPHKQYELLLITRRLTAQALAVAVIHRQDEICQLIDFIGDLKYLAETLKQVRRMAGIWGMKQVMVWITENFAEAYPQQRAEQQDLGIQIPHSIWCQGVPPEDIDGRWWLMAGDTDFM